MHFIKNIVSNILCSVEDKEIQNPYRGWVTIHRISAKRLENFDVLFSTLIKNKLIAEAFGQVNYLEVYFQDQDSPDTNLIYLGTYLVYTPALGVSNYPATHTLKCSLSTIYLYPALNIDVNNKYEVENINIPRQEIADCYPYHNFDLYKTFTVITKEKSKETQCLGAYTISKLPNNTMGSLTLTSEKEFHNVFIPEEYPVSGFTGSILCQDKGVIDIISMGINKKYARVDGSITYRVSPDSIILSNGIDSIDKVEWSTKVARSGLFLLTLNKSVTGNIGRFNSLKLENTTKDLIGVFSIGRSTSNITHFTKVHSKTLSTCHIQHSSDYSPSTMYTGLGEGVSLMEVNDLKGDIIGCVLAGVSEFYPSTFENKVCVIEYKMGEVEVKHINCNLISYNKHFLVFRFNKEFKESTDLKAKKVLRQWVNIIINSKKHADVCTLKPITTYTNSAHKSYYAEEVKVKKVLKRTQNTVVLECGV